MTDGTPTRLKRAEAVAREAHDGVPDKAGRPYIEHPLAVAEAVEPHGQDAQIVALLHDVVEDTPVTFADLDWVGERLLAAIVAITREECEVCHGTGTVPFGAGWKLGLTVPCTDCDGQGNAETYKEYIRRCAKNKLARIVKRADVEHNLSPERHIALEPAESKGLQRRYEWTLRYLDSLEK